MISVRLFRFFVVLIGALVSQGCTQVQSIAAFEFTVRVVDLADGKAIAGAEVFPFLSSGVADRPSVDLGPIKTDELGIARVKFSGQSVKTSSFDSYFVGGYDSWPWIYVIHPDYERSGYFMPDDTERAAIHKEEIVFKLTRKKEPNRPPEPIPPKRPGSA